jgi:hypothetical protein
MRRIIGCWISCGNLTATSRNDTTVPVEIIRDGKTKALEVTIKEQSGTEQLAGSSGVEKDNTGTLNGVGVSNLYAVVDETQKVG